MEQAINQTYERGPGNDPNLGRRLGAVGAAGRPEGSSVIEDAIGAVEEMSARVRRLEMIMTERHLEAFGPVPTSQPLKTDVGGLDKKQGTGRERLQVSLRGAHDAVTRLEQIAASLVAQI